MNAHVNTMTRKQKKALRDRLMVDMETLFVAKRRTMADRITAILLMCMHEKRGYGRKRIRILYEDLKHECDVQLQNMNDTGDTIFFADLHYLGLDDLVQAIKDDYAAEIEAAENTIFTLADNTDPKG